MGLSSVRNHDISSRVQFRKPAPGQLPYYEVSASQLSHGASLGNRKIWVTTQSTGHIERIFCNAVGKNLLGSLIVNYAVSAKVFLGSIPQAQSFESEETAYAFLEPEGPEIIRIFPFHLERSFDLPGELHVRESVMTPRLRHGDPPVVLQHIEISNSSSRDATILIAAHVDMKGDLGDDLLVRFDRDLGALEVRNENQPEWTRLVGVLGHGAAYRMTRDLSAGYAADEAHIFDTQISAPGPFGEIQLTQEVAANSSIETTIVAVVSDCGMDDAKEWYSKASDFKGQLRAMTRLLIPILATANVESPDPVINEGIFWAKVNMLKVIADYPQGSAFTNEPGKSTNVVGRDVAWFVYGCDFAFPDFCKQLLLKFAEKQYENGKMPEYYNALDGRIEDYGLSMNDDTPLFLLACCHHYWYTSDREFAQNVYPALRKAAEYVLSQRDQRGLVTSDASGHNVWGIASWRNVIPDYQINGVVTEINSECYAALKDIARMGAEFGDSDDAAKFDTAANELRDAINRHLLNPENGMYYLNIDTAGVAHTDVTADEVFPVLFGVASSDTAKRIISRLRADDFMTNAGLRVTSRNSPDYEPSTLVGLKGGVWPGVAFWYAFAAADIYPHYMVESLHASYQQYLADPLKNNTVPGQFSEWFDGESLVNRGMRLSPWEPPRLLWAAVEGLCGVTVKHGVCSVAPRCPEQWRWLGLRRMHYKDSFLTFFAIFEDGDTHLYSNLHVETPHQLHVAGEDVSNKVLVGDHHVHRAGFIRNGEITVCLGSEESESTTFTVLLDGIVDPNTRYRVCQQSRLSGWLELGTRRGSGLSSLAINIEAGEYRVIVLTP